MSTTWSSTGDRSVKAICTTGTEAAPSAATDGLDLVAGGGVAAVAIFVEATDGVSTISAGTVDLYQYNSISSHWGKLASGSTFSGSVDGGAVRFSFPLLKISPIGRLAAVPTGLGVAVTVYLNGFQVYAS